nr:hypothetical protein [uncultured Draconibacterium sp.]
MQSQNENLHDEPKLFWYSKLLELGKLPFFRQIGLLISLVFISVAPEIPVSLRNSYTGPDGLRAGIIGYIITFVFTFLANTLGTFLNGTLIGNNDKIIYFLQDWWNLALYILICPLYVGLTCWLVVLVIKSWNDIYDYQKNDINKNSNREKFKMIKAIALALLILSVAFFLTTNYINDVLTLKESNQFYWFLTDVDGQYELRGIGIFYFLLNFSLLIVTLIALTFFMSIYKLLMKVGKSLATRQEIGKLEFQDIKAKLSTFTEGYIVTKGIIATYIVNIWIWIASPIGKGTTINLIIALALLTIIGFFLVSFPRYFVELQWYKLKLRATDKDILNKSYEDLRTFRVKIIAQVLDWIFIGGFAFYAVQKIFELVYKN